RSARCVVESDRTATATGEGPMTIASDLAQRHVQTLVADTAQWQTLIADDLVWELVYAPSIGHPARLSGRAEVLRHVAWFLGAVDDFGFSGLRVSLFDDPKAAVAAVREEAWVKLAGVV